MKNIFGAAFLFCCVAAPSALAKDTGYRARISERTKAGEFFDKSFATMTRSAAPGRKAIVDSLLSKFGSGVGNVDTSNVSAVSEEGETTLARGKGWFLEVRQSGEVFRYRNTAELNKGGVGTPLANRLTDAAATEKASKFVSDFLADTVVLGPGETLNPWYVSFKIVASGLASEIGVEPDKRVSAIKVVFTRAIDGVPVLGSGSKVTVFLTHDGQPAGFEVNWSRLQRESGEQKSLGSAAAQERVATLLHRNTSTRQAATSTYFECGLYDAGTGAAGTRLQPACLHSYSLALPASGLVSRMARIDTIPIGTAVQREPGWVEAEIFAR